MERLSSELKNGLRRFTPPPGRRCSSRSSPAGASLRARRRNVGITGALLRRRCRKARAARAQRGQRERSDRGAGPSGEPVGEYAAMPGRRAPPERSEGSGREATVGASPSRRAPRFGALGRTGRLVRQRGRRPRLSEWHCWSPTHPVTETPVPVVPSSSADLAGAEESGSDPKLLKVASGVA